MHGGKVLGEGAKASVVTRVAGRPGGLCDCRGPGTIVAAESELVEELARHGGNLHRR
jgi:hypothetical protein